MCMTETQHCVDMVLCLAAFVQSQRQNPAAKERVEGAVLTMGAPGSGESGEHLGVAETGSDSNSQDADAAEHP